MRTFLVSTLFAVLSLFPSAALEIRPQDRIVFVGNTFAEILGASGYFETLLTSRFPDHRLTFRNLGWSADTVSGVLATEEMEQNRRPLNFGDQMRHLHEQKPDVIFACYGMAESFLGANGLPKFEADLTAWALKFAAMDFSGKGKPRLVFVSPIAHEPLGGKHVDPEIHNLQLAEYTEAMKRVAIAAGAGFIDLFGPTQRLQRKGERLTINGIHLNDYGNWKAAQLMMDALGFPAPVATISLGAESLRKPFEIAQDVLPPPLPRGVKLAGDQLECFPLVRIPGLANSSFALRGMNSNSGVFGNGQEWERGVRLTEGPAQDQANRLLATVNEKNLQFFYRYRALNGEYIYGRRAAPFGVLSFPPELKQLDQTVAERDREIWELSKPASSHTFRLNVLSF